jgi:hypothetical protein
METKTNIVQITMLSNEAFCFVCLLFLYSFETHPLSGPLYYAA